MLEAMRIFEWFWLGFAFQYLVTNEIMVRKNDFGIRDYLKIVPARTLRYFSVNGIACLAINSKTFSEYAPLIVIPAERSRIQW
jgi:hypothetical protein